MQGLATSWMVYRMTSSPLWLGISAFSSMIPMFLLGLFAGVFVDRMNQHKVLIWTQSLAAVQALILAGLTFSGKINLTELITLNIALGVINCFDMATRQAFVVRMLDDKRDLPNAIALNSTVMNGTRLIGPALAGVAISLLGEGWCFLLNSLSYVAVLVALLLIKVPQQTHHHEGAKLMHSLKTGFEFAFKNPTIRGVLLLLGFMSMFGLPFNTLFPALAERLGGGANALGLITGFSAAGALVGAVFLTRRGGTPLLGKIIGYASLTFSVFLILIANTKTYWLMLPCIFLTGGGMMLMLASGNTVMQYLVKDEMRGRVMSFFNFSLLGIAPFGSLFMGAVAQRIGITNSLYVNGVLCLIGSIVFLQHGTRINTHIAGSQTPNSAA
jgi:MFS family permease